MKKTLLQISIFAFLLLSFVVSCTETTKIETISINPDDARDISLSEFVDSVKYIKLQTDSNCYTGRILEIIIRNKYIYLNDYSQKAIIVFDKKGKFITKLVKQGNGPEEYNAIDGFFVDSTENYIEIHDNTKSKVIKYKNISFSFESKIDIKRISSNTIRQIDNYVYHSTHRIDNVVDEKTKEVNNADIIICKDGKIEKLLFPKKIVTNNNYYSVFSESFIINDEN
ncbi:MAG: 6-bladed beta-propeller [Bacteroidales bacterium]|nr:6-bladed beta-propeller [Bacteroidales bacterium]